MRNEESSMHPILQKFDDVFLISKMVTSRKMLAMFALGLSAGLPIMLVYSTLSFWLTEAGVSRTNIGLFVWVGFAYSLKFLWAPIVDRFRIPLLSNWFGNRLAWTAIAILGVSSCMVAMGFQDPSKNLFWVAVCALGIAFFSATLDICVDAWRVDAGENDEQASLSAIYLLGYRLAMIIAVTGVLWVADLASWPVAYWSVAALSFAGLTTPLWANRTDQAGKVYAQKRSVKFWSVLLPILVFGIWVVFTENKIKRALGTLKAGYSELPTFWQVAMPMSIGFMVIAIPFLYSVWLLTSGRKIMNGQRLYTVPVIGDFSDVVRRFGWPSLLIILIILTYRISDYTMGVMAPPLYLDLAYEKSTIGTAKGVFGISMLVIGAFIGGWHSLKHGLPKTLIIGAILTIVTNLSFAAFANITLPLPPPELYSVGRFPEPPWIYLFTIIGLDNLAAGFASTVFIAFMSTLTNRNFSASQYALFSSLYAFSGKFLAGFSGFLADGVGYVWFFVITALFGVPALIGVIWARKIQLIDTDVDRKDSAVTE